MQVLKSQTVLTTFESCDFATYSSRQFFFVTQAYDKTT